MSGTVELIRDRLRDAILSGEFPPGESATQVHLAAQLGVSRTPLREVLRMLELEGLVIREPNARFRVSPLSISQIEELAVMRINLEAVAIALTVPRSTHLDHAMLEGLLAQMERYATVQDWVGVETPHREFHQKIVSGAGDRITVLLAQLWAHATRYRTIAFQQLADNAAGWEMRHAEHRYIVDAFENHDPRLAAGLLVSQIARSAISVAHYIDPDHPVSRVRDALEGYARRHGLPGVIEAGRVIVVG